jgi:hypothetical protein
MFAGKKRVHAHTRLFRQFLEAAAFNFMGKEDLALPLGKLVERFVQFFQENAAGVSGVRTGILGGEKVLQQELFAVIGDGHWIV